MADREEYTDLEALIASDGWKRFAAHVKQTWEEEFHRRTLEAIGSQPVSDEHTKLALDRLRQIAAIRQEVTTLLQWPSQRMGQLQQAELASQPSMSRRGGA